MTIKILELPITSIEIKDRNRKFFGDVKDLALSIKENGLIHPPAVWARSDGTYLLLAGERRLRAHIELGREVMPCRIFDRELNEIEIKSIELAENLDRLDITWQEKVTLQKQIHDLQVQVHGEKHSTAKDAPGWSVRDTANLLGKGSGGVVQDINIARALEEIPELAKCRTKDEAVKTLKRLTTTVLRDELVKQLTDAQSEISIDAIQQVMIDNYVIGDFLIEGPKIQTEVFDLIEIDPPYAIDLHRIKKGDDPNAAYNEIPISEYIGFMEETLRQAWRTLRSGGWLILWHASEWSNDLFELAQKCRFEGSQIAAIWSKQGFSGQAMHPELYLANTYERFFYLRKGKATILKQGRSNEFKFQPVPSSRKLHPTERPIEMMEEILQTFVLPGSKILIPFLGSGNTLIAAYNLKMQAVGFDLSEEYKNSFTLKVIAGKPGEYRSLS